MANFLGSWANIPEHNYLAHCSVRQVIVVPGCYFAQQPGKRLLGALFGTKKNVECTFLVGLETLVVFVGAVAQLLLPLSRRKFWRAK